MRVTYLRLRDVGMTEHVIVNSGKTSKTKNQKLYIKI